MSQMRLGVFGGMFDPVHHGHLRPALEVAEQARLDHVRLLPCAIPPHRDIPSATAEQRRDMLELAVADYDMFSVDSQELERSGTSYTIDTLESLRAELPEAMLVLMLGEDAFAGLHRWHRWQEIFSLAQVVIMRRPGGTEEFDAAIDQELSARRCPIADLPGKDRGAIAMAEVTPLQISSTLIRHVVGRGEDPGFLVPEPVARYLREKRIY
ncbi:MAG: nicotinate-nucleotide adenylyltransferase [Gammaproteobacteria bacterium]|nr:nicotinate-nucleotide adenylyltransferase [Gammaproteobacteria bacterium]